jgi:hypothetical protein
MGKLNLRDKPMPATISSQVDKNGGFIGADNLALPIA